MTTCSHSSRGFCNDIRYFEARSFSGESMMSCPNHLLLACLRSQRRFLLRRGAVSVYLVLCTIVLYEEGMGGRGLLRWRTIYISANRSSNDDPYQSRRFYLTTNLLGVRDDGTPSFWGGVRIGAPAQWIYMYMQLL